MWTEWASRHDTNVLISIENIFRGGQHSFIFKCDNAHAHMHMSRLTVCLLQWRHIENVDVSNHPRLDGLLNRLFRRRPKKTSKLRVTWFGEGNSSVTDEFPTQRASNAENVSIWWRHRGLTIYKTQQWDFLEGYCLKNVRLDIDHWNGSSSLSHCGLVKWFGAVYVSQHWFK